MTAEAAAPSGWGCGSPRQPSASPRWPGPPNTLPVFAASAPFEQLSRQILAGEAFREEVLSTAIGRLEARPDLTATRAACARAGAVLRLRLLESALDGVDPAAIDARALALRRALHQALALTPADAFLWLTLYWLKTTRSGFAPGNLQGSRGLLRARPARGLDRRPPRAAGAGGVCLPRRADPAARDRRIRRHGGLPFINEAAGALTGPGWAIRDRLVASLADVDLGVETGAGKRAGARGLPGQHSRRAGERGKALALEHFSGKVDTGFPWGKCDQ